ncbi:MAG: metal ABC transporter solute-binding protein, Zn/Mn family [Armatimonadota bacterium]
MSLRCAVAVGVLAGLATGGCRRGAQPVEERPSAHEAAVHAIVSIPPQAYFVERLGGERVAVSVLVEPGQSPETYEPTPAQMTALGEADVYFRIGMPFEEGLVARIEASMPGLRVVDTREGIQLRPMEAHGHAHGAKGALDPHTWLAPRLVIRQAHTIATELAALDPTHADDYEARRREFARELMALHEEIAETLRPVRGREIVVFHPSFGYFCDAFGLRQVPIEAEGKEPGPRQLEEIIARAKAQKGRAIFVQPQFAKASAEAIAREIGAEVVTLDPLARDYPANLREIAHAVLDGLR